MERCKGDNKKKKREIIKAFSTIKSAVIKICVVGIDVFRNYKIVFCAPFTP
jgi:hypothetical protein